MKFKKLMSSKNAIPCFNFSISSSLSSSFSSLTLSINPSMSPIPKKTQKILYRHISQKTVTAFNEIYDLFLKISII